MSPKQWGRVLTLLLCLAAVSARAQSVVVLEFSGDRGGRLRKQVEAALKARKAKVIPLQRYKFVAAKAKFRGGRAMTPAALAAVARTLKIDAAVEGTLEESFFVRILDAQGNELWSKDLPVRRGLVSVKNSKRLAAAVTTAARMAAKGEGPAAPAPDEAGGEDASPAPAPPPPAAQTPAPAAPPPPAEVPQEAAPKLPRVAIPDPPENETPEQRKKRQRDEWAESHTAVAPVPPKPQEIEADERPRIGPRIVTLQLAGLTTWRSFCARPGVSSCGEFDSLEEQDRPSGERVDFSAQVPYLGLGAALELFPLARVNSFIKGLGFGATYGRGFSLTNVRVESAAEETAGTEVVSVEQAYSLYAAPRYFFPMSDDGEYPLSGYVGVRAGLSGRSFEVDRSAAVPLPGSQRSYPLVGLDTSFPLATWIRLEASGFFFINPKAGPQERALYGQNAQGSGWSAEAGASGDIWGPFGYVLRFRYAVYKDQFSGGGSKWTQVDSGASRETYTGLFWGLTAHY